MGISEFIAKERTAEEINQLRAGHCRQAAELSKSAIESFVIANPDIEPEECSGRNPDALYRRLQTPFTRTGLGHEVAVSQVETRSADSPHGVWIVDEYQLVVKIGEDKSKAYAGVPDMDYALIPHFIGYTDRTMYSDSASREVADHEVVSALTDVCGAMQSAQSLYIASA